MTTLSGLTHEEVLASSRRPGSARCRAAAPRCSPSACASWSRRGRSTRTSGSTRTGSPTGSASRRTARCSTATSRPTRSASTTCCGCATLQDETGGFLAFVPLAFHPENTVFERRGWTHTAGSDDLKLLAVSRLLLDNVAAREGLLDHDGHAAGGRGPALRRGRRPGHRRARGDLPRRRARTTRRSRRSRSSCATCARPAGFRFSATRSTRSSTGGRRQRSTLSQEHIRDTSDTCAPRGARLTAERGRVGRRMTRARQPEAPVLVRRSSTYARRSRSPSRSASASPRRRLASQPRRRHAPPLGGERRDLARARVDLERPVCSGAESFIAGTASCRIVVEGVDEPTRARRGRPAQGLAGGRGRHRLRHTRVRTRDRDATDHLLPVGRVLIVLFSRSPPRDPSRPHQLREHGAGLLPPRRRGRGGRASRPS